MQYVVKQINIGVFRLVHPFSSNLRGACYRIPYVQSYHYEKICDHLIAICLFRWLHCNGTFFGRCRRALVQHVNTIGI